MAGYFINKPSVEREHENSWRLFFNEMLKTDEKTADILTIVEQDNSKLHERTLTKRIDAGT